MNAHEFRTPSDLQKQARMSRLLAARRAAESAQEARVRTLPTPRMSQGYTPKPVSLWLLAVGATLWTLLLLIGLVLTADRLGWLS